MMRNSYSIERRLNKHAPTVLIGGIFLCFSVLMYLSLCNMTCDDPTYAAKHDTLKGAQSDAFWNGNILSPKRNLKTFLFIIVFTSPSNDRRRDVIRETWAHELHKDAIVRFFIGKHSLSEDEKSALQRENLIHNDLIFLPDLNDSFETLTLKLLNSIIWLDRNVDFQYMLKTDDDSLVRVDKIIMELNHRPRNKYYWGFFDGRAPNFKQGKWAETEWVLCDRYLPYALGGGYIISSDLVHYVASNSKLLKYFKNEDVSLGTWLAPLDIQRIHDPRFDTEFKSRGCRNSYLITHKVQSNVQMRELYSNLQTTGKLCRKEFQTRKSYKYNWSVLPSQCCTRNDSNVP